MTNGRPVVTEPSFAFAAALSTFILRTVCRTYTMNFGQATMAKSLLK